MSSGRILLDASVAEALSGHASVAEALSGHAIVDAAAGADTEIVGIFPGRAGDRLALARRSVHPGNGRPATLEEIVLGYLAAGSAVKSVAAEWAA